MAAAPFDETPVAELPPPPAGWRLFGWIALTFALAFAVHTAAALILSIVVAALLALLLAPAVKALVRLKIPQAFAAAMVMLSLVALVVGLAVNLYEPVQKWANFGPADLRMIDRKLRTFVKPMQSMQEMADKMAQIASPDDPRKTQVVVERGEPFALVTSVQDAVFSLLTTLMLAYFLLASGDIFLRKAVRVMPKLRDKIRVVEIAREVQTEIGRYFLTITFLSVCLGTATALSMWALGMPTPLLWGVMAGLLNFVPYLGPIIALLVISLVSLFTFDQPMDIVAPPAVFLLLHFIEGQLAEPMIMGDRFAINPVVIFVWVLIWGWLGGAIGVLIAVPLLVALRICAQRIDSMAKFAEIIGN
ncbi:MAG TPA: AI-2E family transporter [Burkholderiales bacterium]|nr:AI-2E family transporter [Burkholderiales bacterium]